MRKMKKLVRYLLLLAIPVAIAAALFVTAQVIACQNKMLQTLLTKMQVSKLLRYLNQQSQNHVLDFMEIMRLVSQRQTIILSIRLTVCQGLF